MTLSKLKLNKLIFIGMIAILVGILVYLFFSKLIIKNLTNFYKVIEVIDGDTIKVKFNTHIETVRLIGVNTPEIIPTKECFGKEALQKTKELLEGKDVYLIPDPLSSNRDKYGRLLRYVFLPNGLLVNAELIREGFGFAYIYEPFQFMKQFDYLEKQAKEKRLGLWGEKCNYFK
jgi:micrococcal nuclease